MPYYELTFEPGTSSVAFYEDDAEMQRAVGDHHRRAVNGELFCKVAPTAERIKVVRVYDEHPNEYNPANALPADQVESELKALVKAMSDKNGVVAVDQLALAVRGLTHPHVETKESTFDSNFKMAEKNTASLDFLESDGN